MKNVTVCTFKASPCVPAPRAHVFQHVRVVPVHTGTFWIYGRRVFSACQAAPHTTPHKTHTHTHTPQTTQTTHTNTQQHTETETEKEDRDREREKRRRKRRDKRREEKTKEDKTRQEKREDSFSVWWCMAVFCWRSDFLVDSVCARDLNVLNSVKYDSF